MRLLFGSLFAFAIAAAIGLSLTWTALTVDANPAMRASRKSGRIRGCITLERTPTLSRQSATTAG